MSSAVCGSACCRGTTTHAVPTSHSIVGEPLTELIPHNEEYREWKGSQLAELLWIQRKKKTYPLISATLDCDSSRL